MPQRLSPLRTIHSTKYICSAFWYAGFKKGFGLQFKILQSTVSEGILGVTLLDTFHLPGTVRCCQALATLDEQLPQKTSSSSVKGQLLSIPPSKFTKLNFTTCGRKFDVVVNLNLKRKTLSRTESGRSSNTKWTELWGRSRLATRTRSWTIIGSHYSLAVQSCEFVIHRKN